MKSYHNFIGIDIGKFAFFIAIQGQKDTKEYDNTEKGIKQFLKENNQPIALGSASKNARPILEKTGILGYFDAIVDGNDVSNAKPDPEVFLIAAKLVNIEPINSIVFEDSVAGIQAANNGKMLSIGIGEEAALQEAKYVFKDFTQISTTFLESLISK